MFACRLQGVQPPRAVEQCRRQVAANAKKKGFGSSSQSASKAKREKGGKKAKNRKSKGKTGNRSPMKTSSMAAAAAQAEAERSTLPSNSNEFTAMPRQAEMQGGIAAEMPSPEPTERPMSVGDELAFENRLAELKQNSKVLAKEKALSKTSDAPFAPPAGTSSSDPYKNPPSIMDTMSKATKPNDDKIDVFGGNQAATLVASIVLAAALLFGTIYTGSGGGDDEGRRTQKMELSKTEREQLEAQQAVFASELDANPNDVEALEGAAVTAVNLGDYEKGEQLLTSLTALRSSDPEAWRLLAETRTALGRTSSAAEAYRSAFAASPDDIILLKGLAGSLVADGQQSTAVDEIKAVGERLRKRPSSTAGAAPITEDVTGADAATASSPVEASSATAESPRLTAIEVDLLLAKVYAQWKGHTGDAFAVYDKVIATYPEDFRGFLAKGVLLRKEGRKSDADRAFLQARFLAPKELRSVVDRVAAPES